MASESSDHTADSNGIAAELDAVHRRAHAAYLRRDLDAFMAVFHPGLAYTQADGRTIGHAELARDMRAQFARIGTATTQFHRATLEVLDEETATETLEQRGTFVVRAFGFLKREWTVSRRGRYEWSRNAETWRIRRVEIFTEDVAGRFSISLR